jgi:hypothetical protein
LSVARNALPVVLTGSLIYVENPNDVTGPVYIQLNEPDSAKIDLTKQRRIEGTFYQFFITNAAGTGTLNLRISRSKFFQFDEAQLEIKIVAQSVSINMNVTGSDIMMPMDLQSSVIMMPIDLQSSYIMMPVDIQAQYLTLDINIKAQTANVMVDIKSQTIGNLSVDIKAQTVGNLTINVAAQAIGIHLTADWAAQQGTDVNLIGYDNTNPLVTGAYVIDYTVPSGKILTINQISAIWYKGTPTDNDNIGGYVVLEAPGGATICVLGGASGCAYALPKPIKATAGAHAVKLYVRAFHSATGVKYGVIGGYLENV